MYTFQSLAMAATAITTFSSVVNAFEKLANTNMAVYWGQGPNQQRLAHFCEDSTIDIIPIAFLNIFPDQLNGGYPGTNFGNQCGAETYQNPDNSSSPLLSNCPTIGPDIKTCQDAGKVILLSLGGAIPTNQAIKDDASAVKFANFLWDAFGPKKPLYTGPRPFGDAAVNGFDFDIESILVAGEDPSDLFRGYGVMIDTLRALYALESKQYYISGAPQCVVPDAHLAPAIKSSWFDFIFVQFYNTPQCSARAFFDHTYGAYGGPPTDISFDAWVSFLVSNSPNPNIKLYLGLPAAPAIAYDAKMYLNPTEAKSIIENFQCKYPKVFGGVMVYEATASETNSIGGKAYAKVLKEIEQDSTCGTKPVTSSAVSSSTKASSSTQSVTNSTVSSSTKASTTSVVSSTLSSTASASSSTQSVINSTLSTTKASSTNSTGKSTTLSRSTGTGYSYSPAGTSVSTSGIPSARSSTGKWNSTTLSISATVHTPSPSYSASASASTLHQRSSGRWNTSTTSSRPRHSPPASLNHYSSGTAPYASSGTAASYSSKTPPYPLSSGTGPNPQSSKTPPYPYSSETASIPSLSATERPTSYSSGTGPIHYSTGLVAHSGPSSGVSLSPSSASSNPSPKTQAVVTTVITTSYVTVCPVTRTFTSGASRAIQTTLSTSTIYLTYTSTICTRCVAPSTPVPVKPSNTPVPAKTTDVVTTEIVRTIYTTCPVTYTTTSGTQKIVQVSQTVSTIYETVTSTICTKCVAPPTPAPVKPSNTPLPATTTDVVTTVIVHTTFTTCPVTQTVTSGTKKIVQVSQTVSTIYETVTSTICTKCVAPPTPAPTVPTQAATTQEVVTTVIVYTTLTTCPVTQTVTSGTKEVVHVSQTVSTIYQTVTSTICTKCIAPPTPAPTAPATPAKTQEVVTTVIVYTTVTTCPVTETITIGTSSRLRVTQSVSTIYETTTSTICTKCVAPPTIIPGPGAPAQVSLAASTIRQFGVGSQAPVASPYSPQETGIPSMKPVSPQVYGSPSASLEYISVTPVSPQVYVSPSASLGSLSETPVFATFESHVATTVVGVVTMTMIPVPLHATPAAESLSLAPVYSPVPISNAPYPVASNVTAPASSTSTAASASVGIATGTTESFTGAANKMGMGVTSGIVLVAGIVALFM